MPARQFRGPLMLIAFSIAFSIALNAGFTWWSIGYFSRQACADYHTLATANGTTTQYDQVIKHAYQHIYALRCR